MNVLIVYWYEAGNVRRTVEDHLFCFKRYSNHRFYYLNLAFIETFPEYLKKVKFDLVIYHDLFFCGRWGEKQFFLNLCKKVEYLKNVECKKVGIPQDEFIYSDLLNSFIKEFNVSTIFSVTPASEWSKVYKDVYKNIELNLVLTGYIDDKTLLRVETLRKSKKYNRINGIFYRAAGRTWREASWLGRHGLLKLKLADHFQKSYDIPQIIERNISTDSKATLFGDAWYLTLLNHKFTIGVEGGASILDHDGTVRIKTLSYVKANPQCSFDEIEANCFPGRDGEISLFALSPRHLEAPMTKTCQILIEGSYNGILEPNVHYIPLKRDFSNLKEVSEKMQDADFCQNLIENAYRDIVASGKFSYRFFVKEVLEKSKVASTTPSVLSSYYFYSLLFDYFCWTRVHFRNFKQKIMVKLSHIKKSIKVVVKGKNVTA